MKKILLSSGLIVFMAAVVMSATGAFFSDTETSTGNTFTAGALDLKVDSQSHFNGLVCVVNGQESTWQVPQGGQPVGPEHYPQPGMPCTGTWAESDLIEDSLAFRFFNFDDLKPGDDGENTISLHVTDNDAWGCFIVDRVSDLDINCTEPESEDADDVSCVADIAAEGELGAALTFDAWLDEGSVPGFQCNNPGDGASAGASCVADPLEGDNILNGVEVLFWNDETVDEVSEGPFALSDVLSGAYTAHACTDATGHTEYGACHGLASDGRMVGSATYYWGLAWNIPETAGNEIQTDSLVMDMVFEIEQHRNNPNFTCTPPVEPITGTITVNKSVSFTDQQIAGVEVNDFELHLVGPSGDVVVIDETASGALLPGVYTVSEVYSNVPSGVTWDAQFSGSCTDDGQTGTVNLVAGQNLVCDLNNAVSVVN